MATTAKPKSINQEQVIAGLNQLRQEQRYFSSKISELEGEASEHRLVIDTLKELEDQNRKCFRMIGGVLVERTVAEVLPSLEKNWNGINGLVEKFKEGMVSKGKEINEYMEKNSIRPVVDERQKGDEELPITEDKKAETSSVLVSKQ